MITEQEQIFCDNIRAMNTGYSDNQKNQIYYEIQLLKDTINSLKQLKQTSEIEGRIKSLQIQIKTYEKQMDNLEGILPEEMLENLKQDERIEDIMVGNYVIQILTNDIIFCGYNIGKYIIEITFPYIKVYREDRLNVDGKDHIFIYSGSPCFGDRSLDVSKSLLRGGFYSVVNLTLSLLESNKSSHSGAYITSGNFITQLNKLGGVKNV